MNNKIPDINKRFLKIIEEKKYSGYRLSKEVKEISESKLTHIRSGRNEPSKQLINALLNKFNDINYTWLLTGEGEMLKKEPQHTQVVQEEAPSYKTKNQKDEKIIELQEKYIQQLEINNLKKDTEIEELKVKIKMLEANLVEIKELKAEIKKLKKEEKVLKKENHKIKDFHPNIATEQEQELNK